MAEGNLKRAHVFISGSVQGVNFRYYTRQQANMLGLKGWVRNLIDGRVEAVFEGEESAVQRIVNWCHEGPRSARVYDVETYWEAPTDSFIGFDIRMSYVG
jgi:acylphosphatase